MESRARWFDRRSSARASSAGRCPGGSRRRTRQRAPLNARLATVANPCSSVRSASSRCAIRSADGSRRSSTCTHQQSTRRPRTSSAPPSPTTQTPSAPRSTHEAGAGVQLARLVADQVAQQAERGPLRPVGGARPAPEHGRAALGVQLRDRPRVREQDHVERSRQRLEREQQHRRRRERDGVGDRRERPQTPAAGQAALVDARPPVDGRGLGKDLRAHPPAIGRRRITSSASNGSSSTCRAWPSPSVTTA